VFFPPYLPDPLSHCLRGRRGHESRLHVRGRRGPEAFSRKWSPDPASLDPCDLINGISQNSWGATNDSPGYPSRWDEARHRGVAGGSTAMTRCSPPRW
jgi:hypothetical protein